MNKFFYASFGLPVFFTIFLSCFFLPFLQDPSVSFTNSFAASSMPNFLWPSPGYTKITSPFGYRNAPAKGAATYHGGVDIAAPEGSSIVAIADGVISFAGWYGANGYTIIIRHENDFQSTYGHVSPQFLVSVGDTVKKGFVIAKVGPKYIEPKSYTTYQDSHGNYTNGSTTGPHLHFAITQNHKKIDPLSYFSGK